MVHELGNYTFQMLTNSQLKEELARARAQVAQLQNAAMQPSERTALQHRVRQLEQDLSSAQRALSRALSRSATEPLRSSFGGGGGGSPVRATAQGALTTSPPASPHARAQNPMKGRANAAMKQNARAIMSGARRTHTR